MSVSLSDCAYIYIWCVCLNKTTMVVWALETSFRPPEQNIFIYIYVCVMVHENSSVLWIFPPEQNIYICLCYGTWRFICFVNRTGTFYSNLCVLLSVFPPCRTISWCLRKRCLLWKKSLPWPKSHTAASWGTAPSVQVCAGHFFLLGEVRCCC